MNEAQRQSYANHARYVPGYHFAFFGLVAMNLVWAAWQAAAQRTAASVMGLVVAVALVLAGWYARAFALSVQDRVIRLEETLRLQRLLPPELVTRIGELSRRDLVALRFAGDGELAELVRWVLEARPAGRDIKRRIAAWRPDHLRA